uniref:hypothetical protein n=1 Tax=Pontiella sp. TaxID=2837462 RepID=UPI0035669404
MRLNLHRWPALKTVSACLLLSASGMMRAHAQTIPEPTETQIINGCELYIYKAHDSVSAEFSNPVLFVEGFDLYNDMDWEVWYPIFNQEN